MTGRAIDRQRTADRAVVDAMNIVGGVRNLDPTQVYRDLRAWTRTDPHRLYAAIIALGAMVPQDRRASQLLAWTDGIEARRSVA
jgi:hypothetical protein